MKLSIETSLECDYNSEIIMLRNKSIQSIEKQISDIRLAAEVECDDLALQLQKRQDSLASSTRLNIDKLSTKKAEELKALSARLQRQRSTLREQELLLEDSPDEDVVLIVSGLRKNVASIEKSIAGRDCKLEEDSAALLHQLKVDSAEMEALVDHQCAEIRRGTERELARRKAALRLEKRKLAVECEVLEEGAEEAARDQTGSPRAEGRGTSAPSSSLRRSLSFGSPSKKSSSSSSPSSSSSSSSSPTKGPSPVKKSTSSPATAKTAFSPPSSALPFPTPPRPCNKTGYSPSAEAAKRSLRDEDREVRVSVQFQKAVDIVQRYRQRGDVLPRSLKPPVFPSAPSSAPPVSPGGSEQEQEQEQEREQEEREQEYKDEINLTRWKQSLRSEGKEPNGLKGFGFCPDEVRDLLDAEMPSWRDSQWSVHLGEQQKER